MWPLRDAQCSAVRLPTHCAVASARCSSSQATTAPLPFVAAKNRGVKPISTTPLTEAPSAAHRFAALRSPLPDAVYSWPSTKSSLDATLTMNVWPTARPCGTTAFSSVPSGAWNSTSSPPTAPSGTVTSTWLGSGSRRTQKVSPATLPSGTMACILVPSGASKCTSCPGCAPFGTVSTTSPQLAAGGASCTWKRSPGFLPSGVGTCMVVPSGAENSRSRPGLAPSGTIRLAWPRSAAAAGASCTWKRSPATLSSGTRTCILVPSGASNCIISPARVPSGTVTASASGSCTWKRSPGALPSGTATSS
mmetsp:Transcript_18485/g.49597  ORF Transcript_18485/g.49597 Transcript_18485/m.49597 type:complete len:306 (+) Transcript_18485:297-1214(+)